MTVKSVPLRLEMAGAGQIVNITKLVQETVAGSGLRWGIFTVFVKHTTASVMIIEDEPGIRADTIAAWERMIPSDRGLQHNVRNAGETNGHSHLRGQLQGHSVTVPFNDGVPSLGRWQQLVVIDFDTASRTRELLIQMIGE
ncbi:MAG: secondary thiamine-phosphate synthase enzyme YjbQ [Pseudomonadota bacterium]